MSKDSTYFDGYTYQEGILTRTIIDPERAMKERREKAKAKEQESELNTLTVRTEKDFLPFLNAVLSKVKEIVDAGKYLDRDNLICMHYDFKELSDKSIDLFRSLNDIYKQTDTEETKAKYRLLNCRSLVSNSDLKK